MEAFIHMTDGHRAADRLSKQVRTVLLCLGVAVFLPAALNAKPEVSAKIGPDGGNISIGENAFFELTVAAEVKSHSFDLPTVDGLAFGSPNVSTNFGMSIVNGAVSRSFTTTFTIPIRASETGTFTIPQWKFELDGETYTVPPTTLTVTELPARYRDAMLLDIETERPFFYLGETQPAELTIYQRADVFRSEQRSPVRLAGTAFSMSEAEEVSRGYERLNGSRYLARRFKLSVTALKAGLHELKFEVDYAARMRSRVLELTLSNNDSEYPVRRLPDEGKPDTFTGAIGKFQLVSFASDTVIDVGQPVDLTIEISGRGNFGRSWDPVIDEPSALRIYPPKASFAPLDDAVPDFAGTKTITYRVVPLETSLREIPPVPFAYFDPASGNYIDLSTEPIPVEVRPSLAAQSEAPVAPLARTGEDDEPRRRADLAPLDVGRPRFTANMRPMFLSPTFWVAQSVPALALLSFVLWRRREEKIAQDDTYAVRSKANKLARARLAAAATAANADDPTTFFDEAWKAIQACAADGNKNFEAMTLDEVRTMLSDAHADEDTIAEMVAFGETADSLKYGAKVPDALNLSEWNQRLGDLAQAITACRKALR